MTKIPIEVGGKYCGKSNLATRRVARIDGHAKWPKRSWLVLYTQWSNACQLHVERTCTMAAFKRWVTRKVK